jgi:hypothetical protein
VDKRSRADYGFDAPAVPAGLAVAALVSVAMLARLVPEGRVVGVDLGWRFWYGGPWGRTSAVTATR